MADDLNVVGLVELCKTQGKSRRFMLSVLSQLDERSGGQVLIRTKGRIYVRLDALRLRMQSERRLDELDGDLAKVKAQLAQHDAEIEALKAVRA
jgi:hypothetical protein